MAEKLSIGEKFAGSRFSYRFPRMRRLFVKEPKPIFHADGVDVMEETVRSGLIVGRKRTVSTSHDSRDLFR
jgi:hypothetical protein